MNSLNSILSRMRKERDIVGLTELRETIEDVRESVADKLNNRLDLGLNIVREQEQIKQINSNLELVKQSISSLK